MYESNYSDTQNVANEQTIANMIKVLTDPALSEMFSYTEKVQLRDAVKSHLLTNAKLIVEDEDLLKASGRSV